MGAFVKLIALLLFMNFFGYLTTEGYVESSTDIILCNIIAVGCWIYIIVKGNKES